MANDELIRSIVAQVLSVMHEQDGAVFPVEVSGRHVHLSREHIELLFGKGRELTHKRPLSQPGQFLCEERLRIIGPSGVLDNIAVLGPVRSKTQVELSASDARILGINPPVRMSGDVSGAAGVFLACEEKIIEAPESAIIAQRHIHMTPGDAERFAVRDGDEVAVRVAGKRGLIFEEVPVRVSDRFALAMHIDFDEANACLCARNAIGSIVRDGLGVRPGVTRDSVPAISALPLARGVSGKQVEAPSPSKAPVRQGEKRKMVISAEVAKTLITSGDIISIPPGSIVTPLARDVFNAAKVRVNIESGDKERPCLSVR